MKMYSDIKVFSCDHRKIDKWDFPYIRIGTGFNNNSAIKDTTEDNITSLENDILYSECTTLYWIWKHLSDFGSPDYVGFCHYRRFLTLMQPNYSIFPIAVIDDYDIAKAAVLSPIQQMNIINEHKVDGLLPMKFPDYGFMNGCKNVIELMKRQSDEPYMNLGMSDDFCIKMFDFLVQSTPSEYKDMIKNTFTDMNTYHFNMFTLNKDLFNLYCQILFKSCELAVNYSKSIHFMSENDRWLAYLSERYSSCIFKMFQLIGKKFIDVPILELKKESYR